MFPSGSWLINLTLPYPDANDGTPWYPFTFVAFGGYSVQVMNIDQWPEMRVVRPQSMNQALDDAFELATIR